MSARLLAVQLIQRVIEAEAKLSPELFNDTQINIKDKPFIQEICYGTIRWYGYLESILNRYVDKPIKKKDRILKYLLLIGFYQLNYMKKPAHAVVSETVEVCKELNKKAATGFVNAILRRYLRETNNAHDDDQLMHCQLSHPEWLVSTINKDWPDHIEQLLKANNQKPPMTLRVNNKFISREAYLQKLNENDIDASFTSHSPNGIQLESPCNVDTLPGFNEGLFSIQDEAAQLSTILLELSAGQTVLDACAAPGGKTAHILESEPDLFSLTAVEKINKRVERIHQNLSRLNLSAIVKTADLNETDAWWDGKQFDRILLDAPCSATGVIRRHPDIKLLRKQEHIIENTVLQNELLHTVWRLLKNGGRLVYATCSILAIENSEIIKSFAAQKTGCNIIPIKSRWGIDTGFGTQILTGDSNMDGFFYAVLEKS